MKRFSHGKLFTQKFLQPFYSNNPLIRSIENSMRTFYTQQCTNFFVFDLLKPLFLLASKRKYACESLTCRQCNRPSNTLLKGSSLLLFLLLIGLGGYSQSILTNPITGTNPSSTNPWVTGQVANANITSSGLGRVGLSATAGNDRYNVRNWSTSGSINTSRYLQVTLTPNSCYEIDLSSFEFDYTVSTTSNTPKMVVRSSVDGYAANIGVVTNLSGTAGTTFTLDLSAAAYQNLTTAITFRVYVYSVNASSTNFSINDFTFNGTVSALLSTASAASSTPTVCIGTALTNITHTIIGATNISNGGVSGANGLPTGVSAVEAFNTITISGTPTASGTFNYSIPLTGGCGIVNATGTITVTPARTITLTSAAGTNAQSICRTSAISAINYTTTGATGVTFSTLPAGVTGSWSSDVVTISGTPTVNGTFNYTVNLTGGCETVNAAGSITVDPISVGGTVAGSTSKCAGTNSSALTLSGNTGSVVMWQSSTSSSFASGVTDIANTTTTLTAINLSATTYYRAVVQSGVCAAINSSTATITITQPASGNFSYADYGFCNSTNTAQPIAISNLTGVTGTFGSIAGLSINATTGAILPSSSTSSGTPYVVTYSVAGSGGCSAYSTTTNVTIDGQGTGTIAYSPSTICTGTAGTVSPIITGAGGSGTSTWFTAAPIGLAINGSGIVTPSTSTAGPYTVTYFRSASGLCPQYSSNTTVTINASPSITTSTPGARCGTGSVVLGATSSTGTVNWFANLTGGTSLASGNTYNTPSISTTTTYYADPVSVNGCFAANRTAVIATINPNPTVASTTPAARCGTGAVTLGATASAGTLSWFTASTGGTPVGTGTSYSTPSISSSNTYFVEATNGGCTSARTSVVATVNNIPTVSTTTPGSNCGTGTVTLAATSIGTLNWYIATTGGSSLGTGTSFTTPSISSTTTYHVDATLGSCTSTRTSVIATIATSPTISSFINGSRCGNGTVNLSATPSVGATIRWYNAPTGGTLLASGNSFTTPSLSTTATYYAEAVIGGCVQPSRTPINATINTAVVAAITTDYCAVPGNVVLTANAGMVLYKWSNGGITQSINVDQAGTYTVKILSPGGCLDSTSISVATELVVNGDFDAGNTGFTTAYTYVADGAGQFEMYPEGTYAVVPNPNTVHNMFFGQDRSSATGNIMVINGSPALGAAVWNQNNTSVLPNTTYYFSAWAMSVVNGNNAILQFSINGSQVGTIAYLPNGYSSNSGPYTWVRFYGQWESGPSTTANLSIVNLNLILGGNDFALDDVSFGTMSPIALSASPIIAGNSVCQNNPLVLNAVAIGGASPFNYAWTGPNGFTSTIANPTVTSSATSINNGTYSVLVTDGFGCTAIQNISVTVAPIPTSLILTAASTSVCSGGATTINMSTSQIGVYYQLRNNATSANIGSLVEGTGSALSFATGLITATTIFNVIATRFPANCDLQMANTVTVSLSTTPVLAITNQAACSGTVNLTLAAVTAGSTGSGTLSYWTTVGATTAVTTPTAVTNGTYFIRSINGSCFDIEPVVVSISSTPSAAYTYTGSPFCVTGTNPTPTVTGTSGVFSSSPAGLVFVNTFTGVINLAASAPGSYTVVNTVTPVGVCSPVSISRTVVISPSPLAGFNYVSNDLCQSANALNASPIFDAGASAGTFSTNAGLSLNTSTGVINISASTPGNYAVVNTRAAANGCPAFRDTTFLDINPYIFTGSVSSSSSDDIICANETVDLFSNATTYATVLLRERFNGTINNWTTANTSTGGTPANAAWTLRPEGYNVNETYSSNDDSQFYLSDSRAQGGGGSAVTNTLLRSPVMSTVGFSTLSLDFFTYYRDNDAIDNAKVQVSTNNTTWTDLVTYTSNQGSPSGFVNQVLNLNAYIGLPTVYIRFVYTGGNDRYWAIDNVSITGNSTNYGYAWNSSPAGYTSSIQNPTALAPNVNTFYTLTATNTYGCSTPASPVPVTVNPLPVDNAGTDKSICGSGSVVLGNASTAGRTYSWTPAATLDNAAIAQPSASPTSNITYTLTETISATGCSASNDILVTITQLPTITASSPAGRCGSGTLTLSAVSSTSTLNWFANPTGGVSLSSSLSFTTPSITTTTTYYVEATSASCNSASRTAVIASVNASPSISSQSTATATYSQNATATNLSVTATAGSGTIAGYQWFSNSTASTIGGTLLAGATTATYVPSTASVATLYYYCVVTNSNGCTANSAVSGAIITLLSPSITSVAGTVPVVSGQAGSTGYRGQRITIDGTNFANNATVSLNGVSATVTFVNATRLTAIVNNLGANSTGTIVVTNPSNSASTSAPFSYIGYLTNGNTEWNGTTTWLGNTLPTAISDATIIHTVTSNSAVAATLNAVNIQSGSSLTLSNNNSSISLLNLNNAGTMAWTASGTMNIGNIINLTSGAIFSSGTGTVNFNKLGDQILFDGQSLVTFNNVTLSGSGNKSLTLNSDMVTGNLIVNAGTTLNLSTCNSEIFVRGNLVLNGNLNPGTSDFRFIGTIDQNISMIGSGTLLFSSVTVNKASGLLLLNDNVQVQDSLTMVQGNINTQGNILEVGYDIAHTGAIVRTSGVVTGKMRRWYAASANASVASGIFPMGQFVNNAWYNRTVQLNYADAPSNGGHLTIEFMPIPMVNGAIGTQNFIDATNTGGAGFTVSNFSNDGYWKIDNQTGTLIDGEYTISLTGEGFAMPGGMNELTIVKRVSGGDWFCPGIHEIPTGNVVSPILHRSGVSGFSNFGFAGGANNALPITLISFAASCDGSDVTVDWTTASELNNQEFYIEESADAIVWKTVIVVPGAGNSNTNRNYSAKVQSLYSGESYFRLTQKDFNGDSETFDPFYLTCEQAAKNEVKIYPNPASDFANVEITSSDDVEMQLTLFSSSGQILFSQKVKVTAGINTVKLDVSSLPTGAYHLSINSESKVIITGNRTIIKR